MKRLLFVIGQCLGVFVVLDDLLWEAWQKFIRHPDDQKKDE